MGTSRGAWPILLILLAACGPEIDETRTAQGPAAPAASASPSPTGVSNAAIARARTDAAAGIGGIAETALDYQARQSATAPDPAVATSAMQRVAACVNCHGADGGGQLALHTPRIGGLEPWYIARQLRLFQQGLRGMTTDDVYGSYMRSMVLMIKDAEIDVLAEHFAALEPAPERAVLDGDASRGEALYAVCSACHGERAEGIAELNTPSLVGQSGPYMVRQMEHYRDGLRGADEADALGRQMVPIVESSLEGESDILDVIAYIESLGESTGAAPTQDRQASATRGDD